MTSLAAHLRMTRICLEVRRVEPFVARYEVKAASYAVEPLMLPSRYGGKRAAYLGQR